MACIFFASVNEQLEKIAYPQDENEFELFLHVNSKGKIAASQVAHLKHIDPKAG